MTTIAGTGLDVFPLCLGGNVFGWTADEVASRAVLDAYAEAGGNFVDTADQYSAWVPGNSGGESEAILGRWMADRGNRDQVVVATKVGKLATRKGVSAATVRAAAEDSLRRLGTDRIDLYWAHEDDPSTPLEETLGAFDALVREGKVRHVGASNYTAPRLREALEVSRREGLAPFVAVQDQYNLVERGYEDELLPLCREEGLSSVPYYALASGFLTGKYRPGQSVDSQRAGAAGGYLDDPRAAAVLPVLDELAATHGTSVATVALAWLAAQPTVTAPIASARTPEQLRDLVGLGAVSLPDEDVARLSAAAAPPDEG